MYAEALITPHPRKLEPEQEPRPLTDVVDLFAVKTELDGAWLEGSDAHAKATIEAVEAITKTVNKALWYPEKIYGRDDYEQLGIPNPITLAEIKEKQVANCFGYTCATSEMLEGAGIDHWIAYGNGHAFILVPTEKDRESQDLYFVDPLTPRLNQFVGSSLRRGTVSSISQELEERDRSAFVLDTAEFCRNLDQPTEYLTKKHPWLVFSKNDNRIYRDHRDIHFNGDDLGQRDRLQRRHMIIVSAYEPKTGRSMIEDYVKFQSAVANDDVPTACQSIRSLSGLYPELDARQEHAEFRHIVDALCESGQTHAALQLIEHYFKNFEEVSGDSRINVSKGDCYRSVAVMCGSVALTEELLNQAQEQYLSARQRPRSFKDQIDGKLKSVEAHRKQSIAD